MAASAYPTAPHEQDVSISAAVMAHPERAEAAHALAERLPELAPRVVYDPQPDGPPSALRTARLAWSLAAPDATHHVVLQDDAQPVADFLPRLRELLAARPTDAVSLFTEWGSRTAHAVRLAAMLGYTLAPVVDDYIPCVGLVLPTGVALGFEAYAQAEEANGAPDDVALLGHLVERRVRTVIPVANLADHDQESSSLVGNSVFGPRKGACLPPASAVPAGEHTLLTGLSTIPYYDFWGQYADACLPDAATLDGWERTSARAALRQRGITEQYLATALEEALTRVPGHARLTDRLGEIPLFEVWIVAFLHGVVAADLAREHAVSLDLEAPVARAALATLGPGAVRRVVPARWLPAVGEWLQPLVLEGVRAGAAVAEGKRDPAMA
ncbi:hypothetical protein [Streptomyces xiaopingdaonensis]|uniref:hypothetical protein n=1 Tax=Streptomyces xiaopingdaonensis TaxID=1565415 RepID=UPI0002F71923|nr:hypothetical protein [Streptomyces xiaopingdaonensis]